mmetsp:Transcript_1451/g.2089  ORF Transcript_1451/g.2089 Transcript_1451/m.2089 type:complete len:1590 (+) Transcript_1451:106-4875(+)
MSRQNTHTKEEDINFKDILDDSDDRSEVTGFTTASQNRREVDRLLEQQDEDEDLDRILEGDDSSDSSNDNGLDKNVRQDRKEGSKDMESLSFNQRSSYNQNEMSHRRTKSTPSGFNSLDVDMMSNNQFKFKSVEKDEQRTISNIRSYQSASSTGESEVINKSTSNIEGENRMRYSNEGESIFRKRSNDQHQYDNGTLKENSIGEIRAGDSLNKSKISTKSAANDLAFSSSSEESSSDEDDSESSYSDDYSKTSASDDENEEIKAEPSKETKNEGIPTIDARLSSSSSMEPSSFENKNKISNSKTFTKKPAQSEFDRALTDVASTGVHRSSAIVGNTNTFIGNSSKDKEINIISNPSDVSDAPGLVDLDEVKTFDDEDEIETILSASPSREFEAKVKNLLGPDSDQTKEDEKGKSGISSRSEVKDTMSSEMSERMSKSLQQQQQQHELRKSKNKSQKYLKTNKRTVQEGKSSATAQKNNIQNEQTNAGGVALPDVFLTMKENIESLSIFGSDHNRNYLEKEYSDNMSADERDLIRKVFHENISSAILVSLAHKRYERRRLAAMEIEKVIRGLVVRYEPKEYRAGFDKTNKMMCELERVRAILLLFSDDYVRSTSEDARKGGVVALAACAIGLKKAPEGDAYAAECRDLILASVVHACQDNSPRVRYYATESLFNVIKVIPTVAVRHFFILFEILRSLYADVDVDVRSGAKLLDKKLREVIIGAINAGSFAADACIPVFSRFVHMRNKPTKRLTLTWLHDFSEGLIGAPLMEFLHLFLGDIFVMVADPNVSIRQLSLQFLNSVLPKLLMSNEDFEDSGTSNKVDFDKILQSLVTTMEHPDPFVRKVAMYWMSRIVQAHMDNREVHKRDDDRASKSKTLSRENKKSKEGSDISREESSHNEKNLSAATTSVRNSLPHVLPGILLSIGDSFQVRPASKDSFLPEQSTDSLAEQTNSCLQNAVRRDGRAYITFLDGFIVALREELDTDGGICKKNPPAIERKPYRMDVKSDGTGIESTGWFRKHGHNEEGEEGNVGFEGDKEGINIKSQLCALEWVVILYDFVVPESLKHEYAEEFITSIIRLLDGANEAIMFKSLEVLAKITIPKHFHGDGNLSTFNLFQSHQIGDPGDKSYEAKYPMNDANADFALGLLDEKQRRLKSRNREVFAALIQLHSLNPELLVDLPTIIRHMCTIQPVEFVFISFGLELNHFVLKRLCHRDKNVLAHNLASKKVRKEEVKVSRDLNFVSKFVSVLSHVLFTSDEALDLRLKLKGSIAKKGKGKTEERKAQLFHILLDTFSHNIVTAISLCMWAGAFLTISTYLQKIDPLDLDLMFYLELDRLIEFMERPIFRDLHLRMLEYEDDPALEGSSAMLYRVLKSILMLLPQTTTYNILKERLQSVARFRQSAIYLHGMSKVEIQGTYTEIFVKRLHRVRKIHCDARWRLIRSESLEPLSTESHSFEEVDEAKSRRKWLGYKNEDEESNLKKLARDKKSRIKSMRLVQLSGKEDAKYTELNKEVRDEDFEENIAKNANKANETKSSDDPKFGEIDLKSKDESENGQNVGKRQGKGDQLKSDKKRWKNYWEGDGQLDEEEHF